MKLAACVLLVAPALTTGACADDLTPHVRWTLLAPLAPGASLDASSVSLGVGTAIAARASVIGPNGAELSCDAGITSEDASVLRVEAAERGSYALFGESMGETTLIVDCAEERILVAGHVTSMR